MSVLVVIPMAPYSSLLEKCEIKSPEYLLLKNGIVERHANRDEVEILCDGERAQAIIDFVMRIAPEILPAIRQIDLPPDL